ncbi:hypothetical protein D3C73_1270050 [compost metagenome]
MEITLCCRFYAEYTVAELHDIQINRQNTFLTPHCFHTQCESGLKTFTHPTASIPQKEIFCCLLRERRCSTNAAFIALIMRQRLFYRRDIKSPVLRKFLVFCGNNRQPHPR